MREAASDVSPSTSVIRPEQVLRPGRSDARNLLVTWFVRRSSYPLLFLGLIGAYATGRSDTVVEWSDPDGVVRDLASPLAGLVLAVVVRIVANVAGLAAALPLAREREDALEPRSGVTSGLSRWLELRHVARAYRSLRWTHHVRQEALRRVAPTTSPVCKLDQVFDIATITLFVVAITVVVTSAAA